MCIFFRCKIGFVNIPAELFFVPLSFKLEVKVNGYEYFFGIGGSFLFDVDDVGSENELFVNGFIEGGVPGSSRVEIVEPLGQGVLDFDIMAFDFSLQPERKCRVVDSCLSSDINLLDAVFG